MVLIYINIGVIVFGVIGYIIWNLLKKTEKLEKHVVDRLKGKVIIINPEESEFAKNLGFKNKGEYVQKAK